MPFKQHTQACVLKKNNCAKLVCFYLQMVEIDDKDGEPSEKLGSQIQEQVRPGHEDQVVLAHDQVYSN